MFDGRNPCVLIRVLDHAEWIVRKALDDSELRVTKREPGLPWSVDVEALGVPGMFHEWR
jgi:hypothetical protein